MLNAYTYDLLVSQLKQFFLINDFSFRTNAILLLSITITKVLFDFSSSIGYESLLSAPGSNSAFCKNSFENTLMVIVIITQ